MKNLAPDITRKRLIIEGYFTIDVDQSVIKDFFNTVCAKLNLRQYGEAIIFSPGGEGKEGNQGYDAFIPLIDSGISLYVWSQQKFFACVIFTCKDFDTEKAISHTKTFFQASPVEFKEF